MAIDPNERLERWRLLLGGHDADGIGCPLTGRSLAMDRAMAALYDGYRVDHLVGWYRTFGRPRNAVVLPAGWTVTASSTPAVITQESDGRQRLYFENNRNDEIQVLIRARKAS